MAQGALSDVTDVAAADRNKHAPAAWNSVTIGEHTYGAPVDLGPMALFYNKEVFDSLHLPAPTTWTEYAADAAKITAANPRAHISAPYFDYDYAGLSWRAGASWFGIDGDSWTIGLNSAENARVAQYWQHLVDAKLLSPTRMYDQAWYTGLGDGTVATVVGAAWMSGVIKGNAAAGRGKWAVAPMPQWSEGENKVGNVGGSATAVLKGCSDPKAAWTFGTWLSTDPDAFAGLINSAGLYPAATALLDSPELSAGDPYFGNQKIFDVFAQAVPHVTTGWTCGPVMTKTAADLDDELGKAYSGSESIEQALTTTATKTADEMKSQGLSVE